MTTATVLGVLLAAGTWLGWPRSDDVTSADGLRASQHRQVTFTGKEGSPTVSLDGRRIAYVTNQKPEKKLVVQDLAGGRPIETFSAPEINYLRWSPDGSELIVWARGAGLNGIYVVPQLGGMPQRVAVGQFIGCWSPDGSLIATAGALTSSIQLHKRRERGPRTLTLHGDHWSIWDLDWSAKGDRLLFTSSDQQGRYTIGTIRTDGTDQQTILTTRHEIPSSRWAPAGDGIYYLERSNQTMTLRRIAAQPRTAAANASGTVVMAGIEADRTFALSADARRLVYARAPYYSNLWKLAAATGEAVTLTQGTALIERPQVSPDGTTLVFNVGHDPVTNLYTMPLAGGTQKQVTFLNALTLNSAWSADGQRLAFASTQGGKPRIWTVAPSGGPPQRLSSGDLSDNLDVGWTPGSRILYQRAGNQNYYEVDTETGSEQSLVPEGSPGWMFSPVYSPDGSRIAVMWNRRPARGIWVIDAIDRRETLLYPSKAASMFPLGWSRDGAWVYVAEGYPGSFRGATSYLGETMTNVTITRIAVNGGAVEKVVSVPADEIGSVAMTPDGRFFVYPVFSSRSDVWIVDDFDVPLTAAR
jgi:Tol biopolymer transport system component